MYYKKESQFTNNASKRVFEEVYTNEDMTDDKANKNNGCYMLRTPQMFAADLSQEKAISPRRVMCEPNAHVFKMNVIYYNLNGTDILTRSDQQNYDFTSQNTMEEILNRIINDSVAVSGSGVNYKLEYDYYKTTGKLFISPVSDDGNKITFAFSCPSFNDYCNFWNVFNQTSYPFNINFDDVDDYTEESMEPLPLFSLSNVWSREPLYVHASFSSSKKHYLCRTGDFWFKPSKYYYDNITNDEFDIFFTTDGTHWIIPYDAVKIIELCFILRQFARL